MTLQWLASPMWLLVNALVAFRLARLVIDDRLPPLPTWRRRFTTWANATWPPTAATEPTAEQEQKLEDYGDTPPLVTLISCYWCAGFWVSVLVFLAASLLPATAWAVIAAPLALSALVGILAARSTD